MEFLSGKKMRKRERLEIIHDILHAMREKKGSVKPTHILFKSNLSHQMLADYLTELLSKDFILEKHDKKKKKYYELTEKGFNYLKDYKVIKSFVDSYGLD